MSVEPSLTQIDYARQDARSRRLLRKLWLPAFLLLVVASAYWWGPPAWRRVQLAYWYHRCLAHAPHPDQVVREMRGGAPEWPSSRKPYVPEAWRQLYDRISFPGFRSDGTAFLGGRRQPDGREVLVAVDVVGLTQWGSAEQRSKITFHVRTFTFDGLPSRPLQVLDAHVTVPFIPDRLYLLAGQPDPKDPTHFTIRYATADETRAGTIDGWVRRGRVQLEPAPEATTTTSKTTTPTTRPVTRRLPASPG